MEKGAMMGSFLAPAASEKMENFNGRRNYKCKQPNLPSFDQDPLDTSRPRNVFLQAALNKMVTRDEAWSDVTNRQTRRRATHTARSVNQRFLYNNLQRHCLPGKYETESNEANAYP
ncbi:MAG TPA: hypothetical protein PLB97_09725 [Accumulibacter sp.]|nr:hypothetical protein [Accumulibacter sp.]HPP47495.1 hypothetical protein [Accumulibacter sp.]